jgi:hypothetical protein
MKEDKTTTHAFRLHPGDDLRKSLQDFVLECQITTAWIVTCWQFDNISSGLPIKSRHFSAFNPIHCNFASLMESII